MASDIIQLQVHYQIGPQPGMNVFHFRNTSSVEDPDPDTEAAHLHDGFRAQVEPALLDCIPEATAILGYKIRRVNNGGGPTVIAPIGVVNGTRPGEFSAGSVGPCLIWAYHKFGGGWATGRTFLPGVAESDLDLNLFQAGLITEIANFFEIMLAVPTITIDTYDFEFGIYSPTHGAFSGIEVASLSGRPGTQRGRLKPAF